MYSIDYDKKIAKILLCLNDDIKARIMDKIESTESNPFRYFKKLSGRKDYSLRVGDYRVIADISIKEKIIKIRLIGHRKNVYEH
jgi:mRNA interferase RelE/StbE